MLTETRIRAAKPKEKPYKLADGRGLVLHVDPRGGRWWRFRYRYEGREQMLSLGTYPDTPLVLARERCQDARRLLAKGINPAAERKAEKAALGDTLEALAEGFFKKLESSLDPGTLKREKDRLQKWLLPSLGRRPITAITAPDLLACLKKIEAQGKHETAHRVRGLFSRIANFSIASGKAERNVSVALKDALSTRVVKHMAAITDPAMAGQLLRDIDGYAGQPSVMAALKLAPLVFTRPGELRGARWSEIDLEKAEWNVSAERMKLRLAHLVPLSAQAVAILRDLHTLTGHLELCFPGLRVRTRPISDNTINAALRRLGYPKDVMTGHGFRAMARTILDEVLNFRPDYIEHQLAHAVRDANGRAYNRTAHLVERRKMMQAWADYLDGLRAANKEPAPAAEQAAAA